MEIRTSCYLTQVQIAAIQIIRGIQKTQTSKTEVCATVAKETRMKNFTLFGPARASGLVCRRWEKRTAVGAIQLLAGLCLFIAGAALANCQQSSSAPAATGTVKHVLGFEKIKPNANGALTVEGGALQFKTGKTKADVSAASIQDVFTEEDFKETIGGTAGTVAKLAVPYGGGRILSLFREKIDVLTVEYRDANGGLHGAIFSLPQGLAQSLKRQLVAAGAHASVPPEEPAKAEEKKQ